MKSIIKKYTSLLLAGIMAFSILFTADISGMNAQAYVNTPYELAIEKGFGSFNLGDFIEVSRYSSDRDFSAISATYTSSDSSVASIDKNGKVTLKKVGETKITSVIQGQSYSTNLYVIENTATFTAKKALNDKIIAANKKYKKVTSKNRLAFLNEINAILKSGTELDSKTTYSGYNGATTYHPYDIAFPVCLDDAAYQEVKITTSYDYTYTHSIKQIMIPSLRTFDTMVDRLKTYQEKLPTAYAKKITAKGKKITITYNRKLNENDMFAVLIPSAGKKYTKVPTSYKASENVYAYCNNKKLTHSYSYTTATATLKKGKSSTTATAAKSLKKKNTYLIPSFTSYVQQVKAK